MTFRPFDFAYSTHLPRHQERKGPGNLRVVDAQAGQRYGLSEKQLDWNDDENADARCGLHNGSSVIGGATDRRKIPGDDKIKRSLSLNGGAFIPAGGGTINLLCASQTATTVDNAQVMIMKVGGFF